MPSKTDKFSQARVHRDVILDGRLALFHKRERWLAIADPHYGYEVSQRAAGRLVPLWGMESAAARLDSLLQDYNPTRLIILGDLVHDRAAAEALRSLLERIGESCEVIAIAGNHDRKLHGQIPLVDSWQTRGFFFHHGHCATKNTKRIQIIGHHHPAVTISDGAGLRVKCPAFVQEGRCWVMPAFSPWASGTPWQRDGESRVWLCTPQRIFELPAVEDAA